MPKPRALLSVSDKTGITTLAGELLDLGYEIISTGGTAKALEEAGIACIEVSTLTGFEECLDGRVKTLHPTVHAGLLARRDNPEHMGSLGKLGINTIDIVAVNLYPFAATIARPGVSLETAIENIDIGGPAMLRSAAKNWQDVAVLVDPGDYPWLTRRLRAGGISPDEKFALATKVFEQTAAYDAMIAGYLRQQGKAADDFPQKLTLTFEKTQDMRYGENPHQPAAFYTQPAPLPAGVVGASRQLHGKELSFNNINDAAGALDIIKEFGEECPVVVAVKHTNPCGVGRGTDIHAAYTRAFEADPKSIFGGVVALNRVVDAATAQDMAEIFLEIIIAPGFEPDALKILTAKKNIRLLELPGISAPTPADTLDVKKVAGGLLVQRANTTLFGSLEVVTENSPTPEQIEQLKFGYRVVKHVKSNGIVLVNGDMTVGIGPGQTNRITALELAAGYAGERAKGSVLASDAFFPFRDCVELAHKVGVAAIIQPGGSLKDTDSIEACNKFGIAMVFTGQRHFKH